LRKASGNESEESKDKAESNKPPEKSGASSARLVTSDGTYATQSAFSMTQTKKKVTVTVCLLGTVILIIICTWLMTLIMTCVVMFRRMTYRH